MSLLVGTDHHILQAYGNEIFRWTSPTEYTIYQDGFYGEIIDIRKDDKQIWVLTCEGILYCDGEEIGSPYFVGCYDVRDYSLCYYDGNGDIVFNHIRKRLPQPLRIAVGFYEVTLSYKDRDEVYDANLEFVRVEPPTKLVGYDYYGEKYHISQDNVFRHGIIEYNNVSSVYFGNNCWDYSVLNADIATSEDNKMKAILSKNNIICFDEYL